MNKKKASKNRKLLLLTDTQTRKNNSDIWLRIQKRSRQRQGVSYDATFCKCGGSQGNGMVDLKLETLDYSL